MFRFQLGLRSISALTLFALAAAGACADEAPTLLPKLDALPAGIASFGAAIDGDWLYIYGGHTGETHSYSTQEVSDSFRRVNLRTGGAWEELPSGPALQGLALVEHAGLLYRVGGMSARNEPGASDDLHSTAEFARFDPESKTWVPLPSLPEGRSSHAAVVLDGKLYVVGGWRLNGDQQPRWHTNSLVLDLDSAQQTWKTLPKQPFERRALAAAAVDGKIYAIGGLQAAGGISNGTDVFDIESQTWTTGPTVPGPPMNSNGLTACAIGGRCYTSGIDGQIYGLDHDGTDWEVAGRLETPRFHHRLLAMNSGALLAVAGATTTGKLTSIEAVLPATASTPRQ